MAIYIVSYDLKQPGQVYEPVWEYFKKFNRCKPLESLYLIETSKSAGQVRDDIHALIDRNDKLLVIQVTHSADWAGAKFGCGNWLNDPARQW
jgi:hypothetical protein